jgi:hypothetical protein
VSEASLLSVIFSEALLMSISSPTFPKLQTCLWF